MKTTPFVGKKIQIKLGCFRRAAWRLGHRLFREAVLVWRTHSFCFLPTLLPALEATPAAGFFF
jgi:hypothetical protein